MSWDDLEHHRMGGEYIWPTVSETREYRLKVRDLINQVIDRTPLVLPVTQDSPWVSERLHIAALLTPTESWVTLSAVGTLHGHGTRANTF